MGSTGRRIAHSVVRVLSIILGTFAVVIYVMLIIDFSDQVANRFIDGGKRIYTYLPIIGLAVSISWNMLCFVAESLDLASKMSKKLRGSLDLLCGIVLISLGLVNLMFNIISEWNNPHFGQKQKRLVIYATAMVAASCIIHVVYFILGFTGRSQKRDSAQCCEHASWYGRDAPRERAVSMRSAKSYRSSSSISNGKHSYGDAPVTPESFIDSYRAISPMPEFTPSGYVTVLEDEESPKLPPYEKRPSRQNTINSQRSHRRTLSKSHKRGPSQASNMSSNEHQRHTMWPADDIKEQPENPFVDESKDIIDDYRYSKTWLPNQQAPPIHIPLPPTPPTSQHPAHSRSQSNRSQMQRPYPVYEQTIPESIDEPAGYVSVFANQHNDPRGLYQ